MMVTQARVGRCSGASDRRRCGHEWLSRRQFLTSGWMGCCVGRRRLRIRKALRQRGERRPAEADGALLHEPCLVAGTGRCLPPCYSSSSISSSFLFLHLPPSPPPFASASAVSRDELSHHIHCSPVYSPCLCKKSDACTGWGWVLCCSRDQLQGGEFRAYTSRDSADDYADIEPIADR